MSDHAANHAANKAKLRMRILEIFSEVYVAQSGDTAAFEMSDSTILLESGLDSLGFAILVTRLEEELEYDPFSLSDEAYYPQTFGEFVDFYHENNPG